MPIRGNIEINIDHLKTFCNTPKKFLDVGILEAPTEEQKKNGQYAFEGFTEKSLPEYIDYNGKKMRLPWRDYMLHPEKIKNPPTYAMVAFWNEFGTKNIPARPFFRNTVKRCHGTWTKAVLWYLANGYTLEDGLNAAGMRAVADVLETIETGVAPASSSLTVAIKKAKGRAKPDLPLVDSSQMSEHISYEVVDK